MTGLREFLAEFPRTSAPRLSGAAGSSGGEVTLMLASETPAAAYKPPRSPRFCHCEKPFQPMPGMLFSCRKCVPCLSRVAHDAVGRCQAEAAYADATFFITVTISGDRRYGSRFDNPKANSLNKPDLVAMNKRLRYAVHQDALASWLGHGGAEKEFVPPIVRIFGVGEYGDRHGRPHYHELVFLKGVRHLPDVLLNARFWWGRRDDREDSYGFPEVGSHRTFWPYGITHVRQFRRNDAYYLAAYVTEALCDTSGKGAWLEVIRPVRPLRPTMGAEFIRDRAKQYVRDGLPLRDDAYAAPRMAFYEGGDATFFMNARSKLLLADSYVGEFDAAHPGERWPASTFLDRLQENADERLRRVLFEWAELKMRLSKTLSAHKDAFAATIEREMELAEGRLATERSYANLRSGLIAW